MPANSTQHHRLPTDCPLLRPCFALVQASTAWSVYLKDRVDSGMKPGTVSTAEHTWDADIVLTSIYACHTLDVNRPVRLQRDIHCAATRVRYVSISIMVVVDLCTSATLDKNHGHRVDPVISSRSLVSWEQLWKCAWHPSLHAFTRAHRGVRLLLYRT
ncbi:hypothetical protein HBI56_156570 [Parastagonospora nodorum]|nr:hypothetical protein HBH56_119260 [Parastagonospora nodorum]KAH3929108.1 hypothetical protein HBH54_129940 [Parastagonospora nodorum]KAH3950683.1 hypothetical protein HBH53_070230 [Parastagonospora nodorum]KAH3959739.1 hypothetical protein HBH51_197650 [Parastagonospora nodorum]KAH3973724.1 hypothetical protein HBH52_141600 [Parastagonospora nodorum]